MEIILYVARQMQGDNNKEEKSLYLLILVNCVHSQNISVGRS